MKNYIKNNLLFLVLVSQPILDIIAYFQGGEGTSFAGYIRLAYTVGLPLYTLVVTKEKRKFFAAMSVIGGFCMLHVLNGFRVGYIGMVADVKYMLLVIHMPVLLISFIYLYEKKDMIQQLIAGVKVNIIITILSFYISFFLKSGNYTYFDYQLGWTGWYLIPNAQSIIMISLLPFMVYFIIKYFKKAFPIVMLPIIFMYVENATKTAYFSLVLVLFGYFCFIIFAHIVKKEKKLPVYTLVMLLICASATITVYNYSPREVIDGDAEAAREMEQLLLEHNLQAEELSQETEGTAYTDFLNKDMVLRFGEERILAAYGEDVTAYDFANMRLKKRIYGKLVWEEVDFATKLVGYEFPQMQYNGNNFDLENDPSAILYYYGYIGAALYICLLGYFLLRIAKQLICSFKECLNGLNFAILAAFGLQIISACYTGYLLRRPNVAFYLLVVLLLMHCRTPMLRKGGEK